MFDQAIAYQARQRPEHNAIVIPGGTLTYAELDAMANRFAAALAKLSLPPDSVVAVEIADPIVHWFVLLALARLGIASACAVDGAASLRIADQPQTSSILASSPRPSRSIETFHASKEWVRTVSANPVEPLPPTGRLAPSRLGRVLLSSGTTGEQKRIGLSWAMIDNYVRNGVIAFGPVGGGPWLLETSIDTILGFAATLAAWMAGHSVLFRQPWDLASVLVRSPPALVGMVPIQLQQVLERLPRRFKPLLGTRLIVGGGLVAPGLAREARLRLSPDIRIVYGASECGAATIADAAVLDEHPGAVGYPMPGVTVEILGNDGGPVAAEMRGEVRIHSDRVVGRYLGESTDGRAFRDGWFYPGDLGRLLDDGLLLIEGRVDDLMNIGGSKLLPGVVEDALQDCPGIAEVAAFAAPDASGLDGCCLAVVRGAGFDADVLRARLAKGISWLPSIRLLFLDRLPRNAMGKVDRRALAASARGVARSAG